MICKWYWLTVMKLPNAYYMYCTHYQSEVIKLSNTNYCTLLEKEPTRTLFIFDTYFEWPFYSMNMHLMPVFENCQSNTVSIKTVFWLNDFEVRVRKSFSEVLWLLVFIFVISLGISVIYENWIVHDPCTQICINQHVHLPIPRRQ